MLLPSFFFFFFFNDTATTEIYPLSLHDALPISFMTCSIEVRGTSPIRDSGSSSLAGRDQAQLPFCLVAADPQDRKSTRLNSSHSQISYAVFCLKKKKT